jgi:adenylate cyclase class 2
MPHETEIKLPVSRPGAIKRRIPSLGFGVTESRHLERNALFDFPDLRLRKSSSLIRLRQEGTRYVLTFKGPPLQSRDYKIRREIETGIEKGDRLKTILEALGLHQVFCYEKYRTTYAPRGKRNASRSGVLVFDETPIGNYIELEGSRRWIDEVAAKLGYTRSEYVTASYAALYQSKCLEEGKKPGNMVFRARKY